MFSRSTGETDDLLGGSDATLGSSGSMRGTLTVNRGYLHYGDAPPPASSTGRRYQGGVSFEDTLVNVGGHSSASSSDGEYSYVEDSSPMVRHSEGRRTRRESSGLGVSARSERARQQGSGFGVWTAVFVLAVGGVLSVVGLVATGVVPMETLPMPAGMLNAFQVSGPGIATSDDLDENLSERENQKSVADQRAEHMHVAQAPQHSTRSSHEQDKERMKEMREREEQRKKQEEAKKKDDSALGEKESGATSNTKVPRIFGADFDYDGYGKTRKLQ